MRIQFFLIKMNWSFESICLQHLKCCIFLSENMEWMFCSPVVTVLWVTMLLIKPRNLINKYINLTNKWVININVDLLSNESYIKKCKRQFKIRVVYILMNCQHGYLELNIEKCYWIGFQKQQKWCIWLMKWHLQYNDD